MTRIKLLKSAAGVPIRSALAFLAADPAQATAFNSPGCRASWSDGT